MERMGTNNAIERFTRELNRRFKTMGAFANAASWERATYLMWKHLKLARIPAWQPKAIHTERLTLSCDSIGGTRGQSALG